MSDRLKNLIQKYVDRVGKNGRARLAVESGVSLTTISHFMTDNAPLPTADTIYRLALACGCNREDAQELVMDGVTLRAKEPA